MHKLIVYRELDEALKLTEMGEVLRDSRRGRSIQRELVGLLRQSVYSCLAGYEDMNPDVRRDGMARGWSGDASGARRPGQRSPGRIDQADGLLRDGDSEGQEEPQVLDGPVVGDVD